MRVREMRSGSPAVEMLKNELSILTVHQSIDSFLNVARYFFEIGQYYEAAEWYKIAISELYKGSRFDPLGFSMEADELCEKAEECYILCSRYDLLKEFREATKEMRLACISN